MEPKKARIIAASSIATLVIQLIILALSLGATKTFVAVAAVDVALIVAISIWILFLYAGVDRRRLSMARRSAIEGEQIRVEYSFLRKVAKVPTKFRYETLAAATDDFKAFIGRGSSGSVFKGILDDGTAVAVKQMNSELHGEREFRAEVSAIASIHHVNLIRLLGYCVLPNGGPRYIVYEFIENGSLDAWIFPRKDPIAAAAATHCLPWHLRRQVAVDVAKALSYLHHGCRHRILHLDIKPENILLDESFRAIVADFGLSKLMGRDESRVLTTVRGTRGYLAPEWLIETGISEKSDIYSYGMVLLELVGGRRNVQMGANKKWSYFPKIVAEMVRLGRVMEVVDERLINRGGGGVEEREVRELVYVAMWCVQEKAKSRPSMERVVDMLEGRIAVDLPPEPDMVILDLLGNENVEGDVRAREEAARLLQLESNGTAGSSSGTFELSILSGR